MTSMASSSLLQMYADRIEKVAKKCKRYGDHTIDQTIDPLVARSPWTDLMVHLMIANLTVKCTEDLGWRFHYMFITEVHTKVLRFTRNGCRGILMAGLPITGRWCSSDTPWEQTLHWPC